MPCTVVVSFSDLGVQVIAISVGEFLNCGRGCKKLERFLPKKKVFGIFLVFFTQTSQLRKKVFLPTSVCQAIPKF